MNTPPSTRIHAIIPLAVLEAVRSLDVPAPDELQEYHEELATKRLGMSRTVAMQIDRFASLAAKGELVDAGEVVALLRLVGRRNDAALVFADAGRRAAQHAYTRIAPSARGLWRALPRFARKRFGFVLARRIVAGIFGVQLSRDGPQVMAVAGDPASAHATPDGAACGFYASAVAAVLRALADFDGAFIHPTCRTRGAACCAWQTAAAEE